MRLIFAVSAFAGFCLSAAGMAINTTTAPIIKDNSPGIVYEATFQDKKDTSLRGWLTLWAPPSKVGIKIHADFWGVPAGESLFYRIYEKPVAQDGNCANIGGILDPYHRGNAHACNSSQPQTCQLGDLSGKHSPIYAAQNEAYEVEYTDLFLSTDVKNPSFFGNHSIAVELANGVRINCANFRVTRHQ